MKPCPEYKTTPPQALQPDAPAAHCLKRRDSPSGVPMTEGERTLGQPKHPPVPRGVTVSIGAWPLREQIRQESLVLANRFRVIRTIDIAVRCFADRPFKAALSAAQRAVRGMVKAELLARYRTDRFMTVYGLTQRGAEWLQDRDVEASASVRRVTDMTNPEHRLWAQFLVLCAEARGAEAWSEQELLHALAKGCRPNQEPPQGLLLVNTVTGRKHRRMQLRPDAAAQEADGLTWYEVDRSARGSNRAAFLRALVLSVGSLTLLGSVLRRVVVYTRTERIRKRVVASLTSLAAWSDSVALSEGRRRLVRKDDSCFEVWLTVESALADGRLHLVDVLAGHVLVGELPIWLPRVRLDGRADVSTRGWFDENYLPYCRPDGMPGWDMPRSVFTVSRLAARKF